MIGATAVTADMPCACALPLNLFRCLLLSYLFRFETYTLFIALQSAMGRLPENILSVLGSNKMCGPINVQAALRTASKNADLRLFPRPVPLALDSHRRCKPMRFLSRGDGKSDMILIAACIAVALALLLVSPVVFLMEDREPQASYESVWITTPSMIL